MLMTSYMQVRDRSWNSKAAVQIWQHFQVIFVLVLKSVLLTHKVETESFCLSLAGTRQLLLSSWCTTSSGHSHSSKATR